MEASNTPPDNAPLPPEAPPVAATPPEGSPAAPADTPAEVPAAPAAPTLESQLEEVLQAQRDSRAEVQALRDELDKQRTAAPVGPAPAALDPEQLQQQRLKELTDAAFYCPGCGNTYGYQRECTGRPEAPHPPIEVVSTDEFKNAPDPQNDPQGYKDWQSKHTAAPASA